MSTTTDARTPASTFLTYFFGGGRIDKGDCYVVERFRALANGDIRRWPIGVPVGRNARARPASEVASVDVLRACD